MDDFFLFGLSIVFFLFFLLLKLAFSSVNYLQLELDKKKSNFYHQILNFITRNIKDFEIPINISYYVTLSIVIFSLKEITSYYIAMSNISILIFVLSIIAGIFFILIIFIVNISEYFASSVIRSFSIPLFLLYYTFWPITKFIGYLFYKSIKSFNKNKDSFDKEDLDELVTDNQKHIYPDKENNNDIKFFKNALELSKIKVRECIIPRTELTAIEINDLSLEAKQKFVQSGHSKILIYKTSIDNIIGYLKSNALFFSNKNLKSYIKNLPIFPESMNANKLLKNFIRNGQNIAVIVDEFGGTSGIVTTEDILEEIFGEIRDEHDIDNLYEKQLDDISFVFSGRLEIDYINEKYNLSIPENNEYETIAGFIIYYTENIPESNDIISLEKFNIKILKVTNTRIELVRLDIIKE